MRSPRLIHAIGLIKRRRSRLERIRRSPGQRAFRFGALALGILSAAAAVLAVAALPFYFYVVLGIPQVERLEVMLDPATGDLFSPTRLYDHSGQTLLLSLAPDGIERQFVDQREAPWLAMAYVASNQPDFWQTNGLDWRELTSPPDTIAEDLIARVLLPSHAEGWLKNMQTRLLANAAIGKFGRERILTWALNTTHFGHWAVGAQSAARLYFNKDASELSLAESALLAAVAQAPALNPFDAPELAIGFQRLVLTAMRDQGLISEGDLSSALVEPMVFSSPVGATSVAPDFTELAVEQLESQLGQERVILGGLEVTTTLDFGLQGQLSSAAASDSAVNAIVLDPINDRLLALSEGTTGEQDFTTVFDPFVYLSAFAHGYSPSSLDWESLRIVTTGNGAQVQPSSSSPSLFNLRQALAYDYSDVADFLAADPAIESDLAQLVPDAREVSPLGAAQTYSLLSQNGLMATNEMSAPRTLLFAVEPDGKVVLDLTQTEWRSIVSPELAYLTSDILRDRAYWQPGIDLDRPAALFSDADREWQVAISPQRVILLWTEAEKAIEPATVQAIFTSAHQGLPIKDWAVPAGLASVVVCVPSGGLPDEDCPETRREWFLRGSEPKAFDDLFQRVPVNSLNGKLATVFTPEEFVQERVFLTVPPDLMTWAQTTGIPLPPEDYDAIPAFLAGEDAARITNPAPFDEARGTVRITGSLGADAVSYDVQVGQGLRPSQWLVIAEGESPRRGAALANWNTAGLSGIWAIQLQVWDADGKVSRAYTVVTIEGN